jgi:hypothetical protein
MSSSLTRTQKRVLGAVKGEANLQVDGVVDAVGGGLNFSDALTGLWFTHDRVSSALGVLVGQNLITANVLYDKHSNPSGPYYSAILPIPVPIAS